MTAATDPTTLIQWKGRPVPWVTRWTGEVEDIQISVAMKRDEDVLRLGYPDRQETRDEHDVLWTRENLSRSGEPEYSQLNAYRQRASMRHRKCQVCGTKIEGRVIRWLVGAHQLIDFENEVLFNSQGEYVSGEMGTTSPPTCEACIPLALDLCPHLKSQGYAILKVLEYEPWGVMGQAVQLDRENERYRDIRGAFLAYSNPGLPLSQIVAKQLCVKFTKFVFEKGYDDDLLVEAT